MNIAELEKQLTQIIRRRRIILTAVTILSFAVFVGSWWLYEATKEVIQNPIIIDGIEVHPGFAHTKYNDTYIAPLIVGLMGATTAASFLFSDFLTVRFRTVTKNGHSLTVYRGFLHSIVYVNGKEQGRIGPFTYTHVVEVWLPDKTRATVSFSRTIWYLAHISFSDQTTSIQLD